MINVAQFIVLFCSLTFVVVILWMVFIRYIVMPNIFLKMSKIKIGQLYIISSGAYEGVIVKVIKIKPDKLHLTGPKANRCIVDVPFSSFSDEFPEGRLTPIRGQRDLVLYRDPNYRDIAHSILKRNLDRGQYEI